MTDDQTSEDDTTAILEESSEPTLEPELDREIVELKESIASLESDLKVKKYQLEDFQIKADKFSSAGYAREVARGVNNKRTRGANNSDTKSAARAVVMQSFLPVLEELDAAGAQYQGVAFAKTFDAGIRSEFEKALNGLGVTEYTFESGQSVDTGRVVAVEEAYSEEFSKGAVIRVVKSGLEISGNVVRPAEVFVSLGSESAMEEAAAEEIGENSSGEASEECADAKESWYFLGSLGQSPAQHLKTNNLAVEEEHHQAPDNTSNEYHSRSLRCSSLTTCKM